MRGVVGEVVGEVVWRDTRGRSGRRGAEQEGVRGRNCTQRRSRRAGSWVLGQRLGSRRTRDLEGRAYDYGEGSTQGRAAEREADPQC